MNMLNKAIEKNSEIFFPILFMLFMGVSFFYNNLTTQNLNITNVSAVQAEALIENGAIVFDVREKKQYGERHIPGAVLLPLSVLKLGVPIVYSSLQAMNIIVYCGDGSTKGPVATSILNEAGFTKAVNMESGIQGWIKQGLPIDKLS